MPANIVSIIILQHEQKLKQKLQLQSAIIIHGNNSALKNLNFVHSDIIMKGTSFFYKKPLKY
jgi:hypothetical protein